MRKLTLGGALVMSVVLAGCTAVVPSSVPANTSPTNANEQNASADAQAGNPKKAGFTMADIAGHNSKESCYTVIRSKVYDLTLWIDKHPGGAQKIISLCGSDGTEGFMKIHGEKEKPEEVLASYEIGALVQ